MKDAPQANLLMSYISLLQQTARLDEGSYPARVTVSDAGLEAVNLHGHAFHPDWHDTGEPRIITRRRLTLYVEGATSAKA